MAVVNVDIKNTSGIEDGSAGHPYSKIQKAVDAANAGDTVKVAAGTYTDYVNLNKSINLEGVGEDKTIISFDTGNPHNPLVHIRANDAKISRFTLTSPNRGTGILVTHSNRITISENKIDRLSYGIDVGIYADYVISNHINIVSNTISNNTYGILIDQQGGNNTSVSST